MKKGFFFPVMLGILGLSLPLRAQFVEDGLRLAQNNGIITARAGALGAAYSGISDDFAALYYNPAGLALLPKSELSIGLQLSRNANTTDYFASSTKLNGNSESINNIGFVSPLKLGKTNASIAVGYMLESDFDDDYKTVGRSNSSIVDAWLNSTSPTNIAYQLYLADSIGGRLVSPIHGGLTQSATVLESGGIHSISGGVAFDVAPTVSIGFALNGKWGNYSYDRRYTETDDLNRYNFLDDVNFTNVDFTSLMVRETLDQEIAGIGATLGLQARIDEVMRFGITIKTPSYYSISEKFAQRYTATFDDGDVYSYPSDTEDRGKNSYSVTTPFVVNTAMSFHFSGLTVAGAVEYSDLSQVEFSSSLISIEDLNLDIAEQLTGRLIWGVGAEYDTGILPVALRAGVTSGTSAHRESTNEDTFTTYSAGAGIYFAPNIRVDAMFSTRNTTQQRALYNAPGATFAMDKATSQFAMQFIYRF